MRRSAHVLRRCACRSALSHPHPSRTYTTTRAPAHPSTPAPAPASTRVASDPVTENDDWAFGGGAKSSGGPVGPSPSSSSGIPGKTVPLIVMGNAGKGAIPNYGKRKTNSITFSGSANPTEAAQAQLYHHSYSPSTRSEQPLPQHTYFSSPSSSFNASSFVTPGTQPPLGGTTTAGTGQGYPGSAIVRKKTALIMPGQGSQYVAMSKDLYKAFRSARTVWHQAEEALMLMPGQINHPGLDGEELAQRQRFEEELDRSVHLDYRKGLSVVGTGVGSSGMRRGWLRDLVFSGDQLELTRAENAQPAILTCSLAFLQVLRKEFGVDLIRDHVSWSAGHGSGVYAALVGSGALDLTDAVRLLRHRGLVASHYTLNNPVLFPPGCTKPESIYETWAFANAGSGKGAELLMSDSPDAEGSLEASDEGSQASKPSKKRGWKRTQMSGVVVRPGKLAATLKEVEQVASDIRSGKVNGVARDEVVEVANVNSEIQIVLSGSRVGVSYCCDRLRARNLGARAVNLPVSGAYHTSLMRAASDFLRPAVEHLPIRDPEGFGLVSSMDGSILDDCNSIRNDLSGALAKRVEWLASIETLLAQGVERFICLGPGRACAHLLSKELAYRDRMRQDSPSAFEVWSLATVEDVTQLGNALAKISNPADSIASAPLSAPQLHVD